MTVTERVLVLGDDANAFLAVVRSLGRQGLEVHGAASDPTSPAFSSRYIAKAHTLASDTADRCGWKQDLAGIIAEHGITMVVPTSDSSLVKVHEKSGWLGEARIATPNDRAFKAFTDKRATRALAEQIGVPIADCEVLDERTDPAGLIARLGLPMVLKPRSSYVLGDVVQKRPAKVIRTKAELLEALQGPAAANSFVEAFFDGEGVGVSVIAREGEILYAYQHRRLAARSETGPSTCRISEAITPNLLKHVAALVAATKLTGVAMFEFRVDRRTGDHILLEVNPRFWGSLPLAVSAGADFPAMLFQLLITGKLDPAGGYRIGKIKRDLTGEYYRIAQAAEEGRPLYAACSALMNALRLLYPPCWDSWAPDDPAPFMEKRKEIARSVLSGIAKRLPRLPRFWLARPLA